jgi:hypothetical protein
MQVISNWLATTEPDVQTIVLDDAIKLAYGTRSVFIEESSLSVMLSHVTSFLVSCGLWDDVTL